MKHKIKVITWRDSNIYSGQVTKSEVNVATIVSAGFVVKKSKDSVIVARDLVEPGVWRGVIAIPRENILKETKL